MQKMYGKKAQPVCYISGKFGWQELSFYQG